MHKPARTVLCVDDDPDDWELVCYTIGAIDPSLRVAHAVDGVEALSYLAKAKAESTLPCLVILDINMPKMDGKQTLAEIKKDGQLSHMPVVVFSTSSNPVEKLYCERNGVKLVIKPSNMTNMEQEVRRLLQLCLEG